MRYSRSSNRNRKQSRTTIFTAIRVIVWKTDGKTFKSIRSILLVDGGKTRDGFGVDKAASLDCRFFDCRFVGVFEVQDLQRSIIFIVNFGRCTGEGSDGQRKPQDKREKAHREAEVGGEVKITFG